MRLPFLQVEIEDSRRLGAELSAVDPEHRHPRWWRGLLEDVWAWGLSLSGNDRPTGVLDHPSAADRMCGVLGWTGPAVQLVELLTLVGVVAITKAGGLRVRGIVERYGRAWDRQQQQSAAARKGADARWNMPSGIAERMPSRSAQTETETETEKNTKEKKGPAAEKPAAPRLKHLTVMLLADYLEVRSEKYKHGGGKDTEALKSLLPLGTDEEIRERWRTSLRLGDAWPGCSTFAQLGQRWNDLAAPKGTQKRDPVRADPDAGIMRHREPREGETPQAVVLNPPESYL